MLVFYSPADYEADRPTLIECIRFQGKERIINNPQEIGTSYDDFGLLLLDDHNGLLLLDDHNCLLLLGDHNGLLLLGDHNGLLLLDDHNGLLLLDDHNGLLLLDDHNGRRIHSIARQHKDDAQ